MDTAKRLSSYKDSELLKGKNGEKAEMPEPMSQQSSQL